MLVSVIVIAFDRREFLKGAVESVLNQNIQSGGIEVIVVKNFTDVELDNWLELQKVKNVLSEDKSLGGKISDALAHTDGDVICLLEDDDYFNDNKISTVISVFEQNEKLGYYHNDFIEMDEKGAEKEYKLYLHPNKKYFLRSKASVRKSIVELFKSKAIGNNSSIAVKREVIASIAKSLPGLNQYIDNLLFFSSYMLGYQAFIDNSKLTSYRLHSSSSNFYTSRIEIYSQRELEHLNQSVSTYKLLSDLTKEDPIHAFVLNRLNEYKIVISILNEKTQSNLDFRDYFNYLATSFRLYSIRILKRELVIFSIGLIKKVFNLKIRTLYFKLLSSNYTG